MSKKLRHGFRMTDSMVGFVLVLPALAIFCGVILYPFVNSVLMSFTDKSLVMPTSQFVGVENYIKTFKDPTFVRTLTNTAVFHRASVYSGAYLVHHSGSEVQGSRNYERGNFD